MHTMTVPPTTSPTSAMSEMENAPKVTYKYIKVSNKNNINRHNQRIATSSPFLDTDNEQNVQYMFVL